jgi:DNA/RNA-binding domain of Phe-tRNA-synthetase-like protein
MKNLPFDVSVELDGWTLFWAFLSVGEDQGGLADLRNRVVSRVRERFSEPAAIAAHPPVAAMRKLFRAAGCDPTRYRPASEALLRRLVKGAELPQIHPLVDVNNCLSAELAVPCCVMADGSLGSSLVFRAGQPGESYESLRGPFNLDAKPLLVDEIGPIDTPITGGVRVKVRPDTTAAWLVAYLPQDEATADIAWDVLETIGKEAAKRLAFRLTGFRPTD